DAVADHGAGMYTNLGQFGDQSDLHEEVRGLRELRLGYSRLRLVAQQLVDDGPARDELERLVDFGRLAGEGPLGRQQAAAHRPPLRSHSAEHENGVPPVRTGD